MENTVPINWPAWRCPGCGRDNKPTEETKPWYKCAFCPRELDEEERARFGAKIMDRALED